MLNSAIIAESERATEEITNQIMEAFESQFDVIIERYPTLTTEQIQVAKMDAFLQCAGSCYQQAMGCETDEAVEIYKRWVATAVVGMGS